MSKDEYAATLEATIRDFPADQAISGDSVLARTDIRDAPITRLSASVTHLSAMLQRVSADAYEIMDKRITEQEQMKRDLADYVAMAEKEILTVLAMSQAITEADKASEEHMRQARQSITKIINRQAL